ncbi:hypothetical protein K1T71_014675 [Dendrolimus kikuchii]|uniref:Uncharacterized protein n=1 Tax=Dendrolimus kikuchii TaxID=765133 RepID=A0ACC1CEQ4_9NEOP|nr:hypothetical protein K1T71_014675 [Dendrolimus kikuchii]
MLKIAAIVSLMLIGSTIWAGGLSCDSCGSECASACGTRHFRSCCFNYLRRKRGPDNFWSLNHEKLDSAKPNSLFTVENVPDQYLNYVPSEFKPYFIEDPFENRLQGYDA